MSTSYAQRLNWNLPNVQGYTTRKRASTSCSLRHWCQSLSSSCFPVKTMLHLYRWILKLAFSHVGTSIYAYVDITPINVDVCKPCRLYSYLRCFTGEHVVTINVMYKNANNTETCLYRECNFRWRVDRLVQKSSRVLCFAESTPLFNHSQVVTVILTGGNRLTVAGGDNTVHVTRNGRHTINRVGCWLRRELVLPLYTGFESITCRRFWTRSACAVVAMLHTNRQ